MRSYSIAILFHCDASSPALLEQVQSYRQQLPFASLYAYCAEPADGVRLALQKMDVTIRMDNSSNRFKVVRRMFTEIDADIFVVVGNPAYPAAAVSSMIHTLVESRMDMVSGYVEGKADREEKACRTMCEGLYGTSKHATLSDFRVFSRRYVKSFAAFERGFPIELEWSMHALELDIPWAERGFEHSSAFVNNSAASYGERSTLARLILNLSARPLKWFGMFTSLFLLMTLLYKLAFIMEHLGYVVPLDEPERALGAASFAIMALLSALAGLLLHSLSHQRRELKRLHFQQHSTL